MSGAKFLDNLLKDINQEIVKIDKLLKSDEVLGIHSDVSNLRGHVQELLTLMENVKNEKRDFTEKVEEKLKLLMAKMQQLNKTLENRQGNIEYNLRAIKDCVTGLTKVFADAASTVKTDVKKLNEEIIQVTQAGEDDDSTKEKEENISDLFDKLFDIIDKNLKEKEEE